MSSLTQTILYGDSYRALESSEFGFVMIVIGVFAAVLIGFGLILLA